MANELLIKINADAKNAEKKFDDIRAQTEDLESQLNKVALAGAIGFAALTAEVFIADAAFREAQRSAIELTTALQNQGIYTKELVQDYGDYADAVQKATGIDNDAITAAQAVAQTYLGQTKITQELTNAIADLGTKMGGDFNGAAEKIARTIGTGTNAFARQGLVISETATQQERYAKVLEFVQLKSGGLAAEMNKADGFVQALATSFGNFQEAIGARFAPILATARQALITFIDTITNSPFLIDLIAGFISAGVAITGMLAVGAALPTLFLTMSAAATVLGVSITAAFVGIPLLIGAVVTAVVFLARNWDETIAVMKAAVSAFYAFVVESFEGLASIIYGALTLDPAKIKEGLDRVTGSITKAKEAGVAVYREQTKELEEEIAKQDAAKKAAADKEAAEKARQQSLLRQINKAELDLLKLQNENASKEMIDLKSKEIETLKALNQENSAAENALLQQRYENIKALQIEQQAEDLQREKDFFALRQETRLELEAQGMEIDAQIRQQKLAEIESGLRTEADIERQIQEEMLQQKVKTQNQLLLDRKKYGESYATLNKIINSDEVQGAKSASQELVQLQQSKNETLKGIGKAAALANIAIATSESAMNIYRGFSTIPIVGPALGIAGAAAAVAFGAERAGQVVAAADGGLITGGQAGKDSVPALLMPGELVVPQRNFEEVVGAVRGESAGNEQTNSLLGQILEKISAGATTIIQGDVLAEESFVNSLIRQINDAVQYRNATLLASEVASV